MKSFIATIPTTIIKPTLLPLLTLLPLSSALSMSTTTPTPRHIVVVGGGIQGTSVAYHLATSPHLPPSSQITILESQRLANAASGKGGGFMARSWGDGSVTETLHHLAFDMYEELAERLGCETYRKIPVLSVQPGSRRGGKNKRGGGGVDGIMPRWLDGNMGRVSPLGFGEDTAQITPDEITNKMVEAAGATLRVQIGTCTGVTTSNEDDNLPQITGVTYESTNGDKDSNTIPCDAVIVSAGPWSCAAEDWFGGMVSLPMEGVKSTSIVWKPPADGEGVDATALFCGEDDRFGTHLEVYPRPDNTIYICGVGGSDYISTAELKNGAFRSDISANPTRVDAASASFREMSASYRAKGELLREQACMRPCPPDALPYMGRVPGYKGAFINAGHNCWGIAWAPACGKAMSELVLEGKSTSVDLSPFDPARFTTVGGRGGRGRKRQGASVGEQW